MLDVRLGQGWRFDGTFPRKNVAGGDTKIYVTCANARYM